MGMVDTRDGWLVWTSLYTLLCYLPAGSNQLQDGSAAEHVLRCYGTEHCFAPLSDPGQPERWVVHNNFGVT